MAIPLYRPDQVEGTVTASICTKFDCCGSDGFEVIGDLTVDGAVFFTPEGLQKFTKVKPSKLC